MRRVVSAALCAASLLACAGPAGATVVTLSMWGQYDSAIGPTGTFGSWLDYHDGTVIGHSGNQDTVYYGVYSGFNWTTTFTFDTSLGVITDQTLGSETIETLTWNAAMGTPSPLLSGDYVGLGGTRDLANATSFSVTIKDDPPYPGYDSMQSGIGISLVGPDWSLVNLYRGPGQPGQHSLSDPYSSLPSLPDIFDGSPGYADALYRSGGGYTWAASLTPSVPEPATWAMLLLGFFGISSVLRRQRGHLGAAA